jgi:hypothetical protein
MHKEITMKANRLYKDILKRLSKVPMSGHTREHARTELRRAVSLIELITGNRGAASSARS